MTQVVAWGPGRENAFKDWLGYDLKRSLDERAPLEDKWRGFLETYRAPMPRGLRRFPFEGASNYVYPLLAMNTDPILARLLRTIHAPSNLWTITALNEQWTDVAKPVQDYLQYIDSRLLRMHDVNYRALLEMCKLGTTVYKVGWKFERSKIQGYDASKQRAQLIRQINQPVVDLVHLPNFLLPPECLTIDPDEQGGAPWVAEKLRYRPEQLEAMGKAQAPFLPNFTPEVLKRIVKQETSSPTEYQATVQQLDSLSGSAAPSKRPVELWEVHARFPTASEGAAEDDLTILWHQDSQTIVRALYNPFAHGRRPYHVGRYVRGDGFYGIGLGEQLDMWQRLLTDVLNYDIDKVLLEHAPMVIAREGANILPNESYYPSKTIFVQDPSKDIAPFHFTGQGNSDVMGLMGFIHEASKSRSGLTDLQYGSVGAIPSRTPATTVQALLQEGNTRFDMIIQDYRLNCMGPIGMQVLQNIVQQVGDKENNPDGADYVKLAVMVLGAHPGQFMEALLSLPHANVEAGLGVELTATSGTNNKELQRQSYLALLQVFGQWAPQLIQLAQMAQQTAGTPVGSVSLDLFDGARELLQRVLEQFDIRNPDDILPNLQAAMAAAQANASGAPLSPLGGGGGQAQGGAPGGGGAMAPPMQGF